MPDIAVCISQHEDLDLVGVDVDGVLQFAYGACVLLDDLLLLALERGVLLPQRHQLGLLCLAAGERGNDSCL